MGMLGGRSPTNTPIAYLISRQFPISHYWMGCGAFKVKTLLMIKYPLAMESALNWLALMTTTKFLFGEVFVLKTLLVGLGGLLGSVSTFLFGGFVQ